MHYFDLAQDYFLYIVVFFRNAHYLFKLKKRQNASNSQNSKVSNSNGVGKIAMSAKESCLSEAMFF